jgi:TolA-binding protein
MRWIHGGIIFAAMAALTGPAAAQYATAPAAAQAELAARQSELRALAPVALTLSARAAELSAERAQLQASASALAASAAALAPVRMLAPARMDALETYAPDSYLQGDPADSLYRVARASLNRGRFRDAGDQFRELRRRYPQSGYVANSMYWEAFALYREGGADRLRRAAAVLDEAQSKYPQASTAGDASTLAVRVRGELARLGDKDAAAAIAADASVAVEAPEAPEAVPTVPGVGRPPRVRPPQVRPPTVRPPRVRLSDRCGNDDESDMKVAALNALLQMDADKAVPILKQVLARRDSSSVCLRRKAVFLVSQKKTEATEDILLDAARNDPDPEVKEQAVFWLSQVGTDKAVTALDSILRRSDDQGLQEKALFALSQHHSARATAALRAYVERKDVSDEMREKAVFWLGQSDDPENSAFLRTVYGRTDSGALKQKILFALSQSRGTENQQFLLDVARNKSETIEVRKQALFWAGQSGTIGTAELASLYGTIPDREMREQIIFVLSQRNDAAAMDKLIDIARKDPDPELRKRALFWVGQSKDPRATQLLQDILTDK